MNKIKLNIVNEYVYHEKLDNGLEIYIMSDKNYKNNYAYYMTNFGGFDTEFIPYGKKEMIKVPTGIAHFLEHKLFEQEKGESVHEYYKKTGTYDNAMTTHKNTTYLIEGPFNFKENLKFLLEYVGSPYFTDKNVEKEKGIILEEESMDNDNPNRLFFETIQKNLFNTIPYDIKVIGTREDIKSITKEELYTCYDTFYHPSNMVLFISTSESPEEIIDIVKKTVKTKDKEYNIIKKEYDEKEYVRKEKEIIKSDKANETRINYALKYKLSDFNASKVEVYFYFLIFFDILMGDLTNFHLELKKKRIISEKLYFEISFEETKNGEYVIFNIFGITNKPTTLIKLIEEKLNKKDYKKEDFELYKKDVKSNLTWCFNNQASKFYFMYNLYSFNKKVDNTKIDIIDKLNYDRFKEITDKLIIKNKSIVILKK